MPPIKCIDCGGDSRPLNDDGLCPKCRVKKKWRTIKACWELAAKYREPEGKEFFFTRSCPLCSIHNNCLGCSMADHGLGCVRFKSYIYAQAAEGQKGFNARAAFFDKIIPILEGIPASRFTKKGWKYFDEMDRSW